MISASNAGQRGGDVGDADRTPSIRTRSERAGPRRVVALAERVGAHEQLGVVRSSQARDRVPARGVGRRRVGSPVAPGRGVQDAARALAERSARRAPSAAVREQHVVARVAGDDDPVRRDAERARRSAAPPAPTRPGTARCRARRTGTRARRRRAPAGGSAGTRPAARRASPGAGASAGCRATAARRIRRGCA